jgi:hypothetical protein
MKDEKYKEESKRISDDYMHNRINRLQYIEQMGELNRKRTPRKRKAKKAKHSLPNFIPLKSTPAQLWGIGN